MNLSTIFAPASSKKRAILPIFFRAFAALLLVMATALYSFAQTNAGPFNVPAGGTATFFGDFINTSTGTVTNNGTIYILANVTNNGSYVSSNTGLERLEGAAAQTIDGSMMLVWHDVLLDNGNGVTIANEVRVEGVFTFNDGAITTDRNAPADQLHFWDGATYSGQNDARHVHGYVCKTGNDAFTFPVGDGTTLRTIAIPAPPNVTDELCAAYFSGDPGSAALPAGAHFSTAATGAGVGNVSSVEYWDLDGAVSTSATLSWNAASNVGGLVSNLADLIVVGWDGSQWVNLGQATVTGTTTSGTITSNAFTPDDYDAITLASALGGDVQLAAKVFLQGAYNTGTNLMDDDLRTGVQTFSMARVIPDTEPYSGSAYPEFVHAGSGGGETIGNPGTVFAATGNNAIVDWVFLELRQGPDADNAAVVTTRAALVQRDGDIVDVDGVSPVTFTGFTADDYYVAVRHRNHMGIMTASTVALTEIPVTVDFTVSSTAIYQRSDVIGSPHGRVELETGIFGLWAGNYDNTTDFAGTQAMIYNGTNSDLDAVFFYVLLNPGNTTSAPNYIVQDVYNRNDGNMDGRVIYGGADSDVDMVFFAVLLHPDNPTNSPVIKFFEQLP